MARKKTKLDFYDDDDAEDRAAYYKTIEWEPISPGMEEDITPPKQDEDDSLEDDEEEWEVLLPSGSKGVITELAPAGKSKYAVGGAVKQKSLITPGLEDEWMGGPSKIVAPSFKSDLPGIAKKSVRDEATSLSNKRLRKKMMANLGGGQLDAEYSHGGLVARQLRGYGKARKPSWY